MMTDETATATPDTDDLSRALDDVFRSARRVYVKHPAEGGDSEDVYHAEIINDIEKHVRQVVASRIKR